MKNFKLLLATTAILSTAVAMNVWATEPSISGTPAQLQASVKFLESATIYQSQALFFGTLLHPTAGQTVDWIPYQSITEPYSAESNAQQAFTTGSLAPKIGIMIYEGPERSSSGYGLSFSSTAEGTQGDSATISLINGNRTCGRVSFDRTRVKMPTTLSDDSSIYVGGRFTVDANYDNSIVYGDCTGSVYITLVMRDDD